MRGLAGAGLVVWTGACGNDSPPLPPSPPSAGATITITSAGVSPKALAVRPGTQVTFVNNGSRDHVMSSDPHPDHTDCPEINTVGFIVPGQSKQTGNLNALRTCSYHDHMRFGDSSLRGSITIQ